MRFLLLPLLFFTLLSTCVLAQAEHRVSIDGRDIEFKEIDHLQIVGYDGTELKINRDGDSGNREDVRAKGMRKISASGKQDNTGFGLSVQGFDDRIVVEQIGKGDGHLIISVPNTAVVRVEQSTHRGGGFAASNFNGELDVSMHYHKAKLSNCYGPLSVNTIYGEIEATFSAGPPKQDIRLHSTYQNVDITLPKNTAANLRLNTSYGSMYTDFDLDVNASDSQEHNDDDEHDGLTGTINGGGKLISLHASYKNIYLRKL